MIRYHFQFEHGKEARIDVPDNGETSDETRLAAIPAWMELERFRCDHCPLTPGSRRTCPAAVAMVPVLDVFCSHTSHEGVLVRVDVHDVVVEKRTTTQRAARSALGLVLALSACPYLNKLRPMASFHMPFRRLDHSAFRFLGTHLIAQYLRVRKGLEPDWELEALLELLRDIRRVNARLADRIRAAAKEDAAVNSLVLLDTIADSVELSVETSLERLEPVFSMYLT